MLMSRLSKPDRRRFLLKSGMLAAAWELSRADTALTQELAPTPSCHDGDEPTVSETEGPFFKPRSPARSELREAGARGRQFELSGVVLSRSCRPLRGAVVDLWHADEKGEYDNVGFRYRGHVISGADGAFRARLPPEVGGVAVVRIVRLLPLVGAVAGRSVGDRELAHRDRVVVAIEEARMLAHADDVDAEALRARRRDVVDLVRRTARAHRVGGAELVVGDRGRRVRSGGCDARRGDEEPVEDALLRCVARSGVVRVAPVRDRAVTERAVLLSVRRPIRLTRRRRHVEAERPRAALRQIPERPSRQPGSRPARPQVWRAWGRDCSRVL